MRSTPTSENRSAIAPAAPPGTDQAKAPVSFAFLLLDDFSFMSFAAVIEPLRQANRLSESRLYSWEVLSIDGKPTTASNGVPVVPNGGLSDHRQFDSVIVISGHYAIVPNEKQIHGWLRNQAAHGASVGAVSTAPIVLARAGLLDGYRAAVHWEAIAGFEEQFPEVSLSNELFEVDRSRLTSCGGTAAMDMMLHIISSAHGQDLASRISDQFIHARIRTAGEHQHKALDVRLLARSPKLVEAVHCMEQHIEDPVGPADLAEMVGLSTRQLERLFAKHLGRAPTRFYMNLRLEHARQLLRQTSMLISDVAIASGFVSTSHFAKCYKDFFGRTPRAERGVNAF